MRRYLEKVLQNVHGYVELRGEHVSFKTIVFKDDQIHMKESEREGVGIRVVDKKEVFLPSTLDDLEKNVKKAFF